MLHIPQSSVLIPPFLSPSLPSFLPPSLPLFPGATVAPSYVRAKVESSTAITVQWSGLTPCREVNGLIVGYRVQYWADLVIRQGLYITEDNPAYNLSGPYVRDRGNKVEYDLYAQPPPAAQQKIVYDYYISLARCMT